MLFDFAKWLYLFDYLITLTNRLYNYYNSHYYTILFNAVSQQYILNDAKIEKKRILNAHKKHD